MIEVLFAESEAASMKTAKSTVITIKTDGPTAVWSAGKKLPPKREHTGWIEGTAEEVICLGFMLDIGDIRDVYIRNETAEAFFRRRRTDPHMVQ